MVVPLDPSDPDGLGSPQTAASWISSHNPTRRGAFMDAVYFDDDAAAAAAPAWRPSAELQTRAHPDRLGCVCLRSIDAPPLILLIIKGSCEFVGAASRVDGRCWPWQASTPDGREAAVGARGAQAVEDATARPVLSAKQQPAVVPQVISRHYLN